MHACMALISAANFWLENLSSICVRKVSFVVYVHTHTYTTHTSHSTFHRQKKTPNTSLTSGTKKKRKGKRHIHTYIHKYTHTYTTHLSHQEQRRRKKEKHIHTQHTSLTSGTKKEKKKKKDTYMYVCYVTTHISHIRHLAVHARISRNRDPW